jgi:hypothetical protein
MLLDPDTDLIQPMNADQVDPDPDPHTAGG